MSIDINTLHQRMEHISMDWICHMVKEGQLQGIQHLTYQYTPKWLDKFKLTW